MKYAITIMIVLFFTVAGILDFMSTNRIAEQGAKMILNTTAYFIGITLNQALIRTGIDEELFLDLLKKQNVENIAFIALYDSSGVTLLHSSQRMIGTKVKQLQFKEVLDKKKPLSSYLKLRTGEEVYALDIPIHMPALSESMHILRIVLHTYHADQIVRRAKIHNTIGLIILSALWLISFALLYYVKQVEQLQEYQMQKKHLARLGEMSAVLAHEIRNPLASIKGFAQYMKEKSKNNPDLEEGLGAIVTESTRLEGLTTDLLNYARIGELKKQRFSLTELLSETEKIITSNRISISKQLFLKNDMLYTDKGKLLQILVNLLHNAKDATLEKGNGLIELTAHEKKGLVSITIEDTGVGMEKETLQKAREPFFTTKVRGTGLGLAIVDSLVHVLKGELVIHSEIGKGTIVTVTIPSEIS